MIIVYHLTDAVPTALFGIFALWAAASKRHWFVRTAVVAAALLIILLIPAYEVVVQFGVLILLVIVGLAIWRRRRKRKVSPQDFERRSGVRFRLSLETLMLLTVVVAVVTAVAARAPVWSIYEWLRMIGRGAMAAAIGLVCAWIVCGKSPWKLRAVAAPLYALLLSVMLHLLMAAPNLLQVWIQDYGSLPRYWENVKRDVWHLGTYWVITSAVGTAVVCGWLFLLRRAEWFDPFDELSGRPPEASREPRQMIVARWASVAMFCLVSVFPLALLYRLLTPPAIPKMDLPEPNGFDDFIAAGRMIGPVDGSKLSLWNQLSDSELRTILARHGPALQRAQQGLTKECMCPFAYQYLPEGDSQAMIYLLGALWSRAALANRTDATSEKLTAYLDLLRVTIRADRGSGAGYSIPAQAETPVIHGLWRCRMELSAGQCSELAAELSKLDDAREPWKQHADRLRIRDANTGWQWHLQVILAEWSGTDRYEWERLAHLQRTAALRLFMVELAIGAHQLETGRLPTTLVELVPKYLPAVPCDPYGDSAINFRRSGNDYTLYCVGPDGDDDYGRPVASILPRFQEGDVSTASQFPSPPGSPASASSLKSERNGIDERGDAATADNSDQASAESDR